MAPARLSESIRNWHDLLCRNPICSIFIFPSVIEGGGYWGGGEEAVNLCDAWNVVLVHDEMLAHY